MSRHKDEFEKFIEAAIGNEQVKRLMDLYRQTDKREYRKRALELAGELRGSSVSLREGVN